MTQNNGVEIIKGHMATNSDSDSSSCGEAVLCTLYHCACQDQDVLPTKQIKIDLNVHEYKWVNPVIMNCSECLEAQWFVITSINIVILKLLSRSLFKRSEVSKIPCKWSEKKVCINLYEAPWHHEQWVTPAWAWAWFIVWPGMTECINHCEIKWDLSDLGEIGEHNTTSSAAPSSQRPI